MSSYLRANVDQNGNLVLKNDAGYERMTVASGSTFSIKDGDLTYWDVTWQPTIITSQDTGKQWRTEDEKKWAIQDHMTTNLLDLIRALEMACNDSNELFSEYLTKARNERESKEKT
jgi:hypothetical protein